MILSFEGIIFFRKKKFLHSKSEQKKPILAKQQFWEEFCHIQIFKIETDEFGN